MATYDWPASPARTSSSRKASSQRTPTRPSRETTHSHYTYPRARTPSSSSGSDCGWASTSAYPEPPSLRPSLSSTSRFSTPPRTPTDLRAPPVVVAAPVADVGTMDALVDGMNDPFARRASRASLGSAYRASKPPLSRPPSGATLGGRLSCQSSTISTHHYSNHNSDSDDSAPDTPSRPPPPPRTRKSRTTTPRDLSRSSSVSSMTPSVTQTSTLAFPTSSPTSSPARAPAPSIDEILQKHAASPKPSISAILRNARRTPQLSRAPSFAAHPRIPEEADLVSRTSVDSIAAEIERSLLATPQPAPPALLRRASVLSDGARSVGASSGRTRASTLSPRAYEDASDGEGTPSLPAPEPADPVVAYLRSTRITTLLTLTREPHGPLRVSLCDLGAADGHPLVVFLGLGCVRHLLGLYDEMAAVLGLRLIAVDRCALSPPRVARC
jgi:hypothetical protein